MARKATADVGLPLQLVKLRGELQQTQAQRGQAQTMLHAMREELRATHAIVMVLISQMRDQTALVYDADAQRAGLGSMRVKREDDHSIRLTYFVQGIKPPDEAGAPVATDFVAVETKVAETPVPTTILNEIAVPPGIAGDGVAIGVSAGGPSPNGDGPPA